MGTGYLERARVLETGHRRLPARQRAAYCFQQLGAIRSRRAGGGILRHAEISRHLLHEYGYGILSKRPYEPRSFDWRLGGNYGADRRNSGFWTCHEFACGTSHSKPGSGLAGVQSVVGLHGFSDRQLRSYRRFFGRPRSGLCSRESGSVHSSARRCVANCSGRVRHADGLLLLADVFAIFSPPNNCGNCFSFDPPNWPRGNLVQKKAAWLLPPDGVVRHIEIRL